MPILCTVCCAYKSLDTIPTFHKHKGKVCADCIQKHAKEEIIGKQGSRVSCLQSGCTKEIEVHDLRLAGVSKQMIETLNHNQFLQWLRAQPNFVWCAHSGCGNGVLMESADDVIMKCNACHHLTCTQHRIMFYEGLTCKQYDGDLTRERDNDRLTANWITVNCKRCPSCRHAIQKNEGCDHMTCTKRAGGCGHQFCWLCLADYNRIRVHGNHMHKPTCSHYRPPT